MEFDRIYATDFTPCSLPSSQYSTDDDLFLFQALFAGIEPLDAIQSAQSPGTQTMEELADTVSQTLPFRSLFP